MGTRTRPEHPGSGSRRGRPPLGLIVAVGFAFLAANGLYLTLFVRPSLVYVANVILHAAIGVVVAPLAVVWGWRRMRATVAGEPGFLARVTFAALCGAAGTGLAYAVVGGLRANQWLADAHVSVAAVAVALVALRAGLRGSASAPVPQSAARPRVRTGWYALAAALIGVGVFWGARAASVPSGPAVENPESPPLRMEGEATGGAGGPFFPSSIATSTGGLIPVEFFTDSEQACGRCHVDIYRQWASSAHHFASFNNPWYRRSVEYMQDVNGIRSSKWCGGCHDVPVLLSGQMGRPMREIADTPGGQAGLGCVVCHAVSRVKSTMGQGDYVLDYRWLDRLARSANPLVRATHDLVVHLETKLHRRTFLKPFHRSAGAQGAEFCVACHKVHLDVPVNNYRWFRGFDEYDAWQASGVSGQGARSFYYPRQPQSCGQCHMPLVASRDPGNRGGRVHSHRFAAANTALPLVNRDPEQLGAVVDFVKGAVSVDVFAVSRDTGGEGTAPAGAGLAPPGPPRLSTTFPVGEEAAHVPGFEPTGPRAIAAIDEGGGVVRRGESVRIEVVVRNRRTGHFFPGGTVDAFDVWVELKATGADGRVLFWSGAVADGGTGPVEPGAHFYRASLLDAHGNPINKRNAWAARSVLYSRLVPPGAADTAHFRLDVPGDARGPIALEARVNYRKFGWWHTQFVFRGRREPSGAPPDVTPHYDDGRWVFDPARAAPDVPIVVVAEARASLAIVGADVPLPDPRAAPGPGARERWNDFGIGLYLQRDFRNAERAFRRVTELEPRYADGWVNVGRVRLAEGDASGAMSPLERALALEPELPKSHYFLGLALAAQGRYGEALASLRRAAARYPRDRVVRNEIAKVLYRLRRFDKAVGELRAVLAIDPEDLAAHYTLMLAYRALGEAERADREYQLYLRFKADERATAISGRVRRADPVANREAQPIHEHRSVPLPWGGSPAP